MTRHKVTYFGHVCKKTLHFGRVYDDRKGEKKEKQRMAMSVDKLNHSSDGCTNGKLMEDQVRDRLF